MSALKTTRTAAGLLIATILLAACGSKTLNGTYLPNGEQAPTYDKLTFSSDGNVVAVFNRHTIKPKSYVIVGKQVQIHIGVGPHNLNIRDDGCLVGTGQSNMDGVYCKQKQ